MVAGILIIVAGIGLLLDNLELINFDPFGFLPLLLAYFGLRQWVAGRKIIGVFLMFFGTAITLEIQFNIGMDDLLSVAVPLAIVYAGFRLLRSRPKISDEIMAEHQPETEPTFTANGEEGSHKERKTRKWQKNYYEKYKSFHHIGTDTPFSAGQIFTHNETRSSFIGDFYLTSGRFELHNLHIKYGIGDVVIDLSRALLPDEETILLINGWIGDVTVYVPVDLPVTVAGEVKIGDMEILGHRQGGFNRFVMMKSQNYDVADKKVKIMISQRIGDIDVKYI